MFRSGDHTFAICAYGSSPYLEDCIRSICSQTMASHILISTSTPNNHIDRLASDYGIKLFVDSGPSGIALDWNRALGHCHTPLVTIAHQDDVYLAPYTRTMFRMVNREKHPLLFFTNYGELRDGAQCDQSKLLAMKRLLLTPLNIAAFQRIRLIRRRILSLGSPICCPSVTYCIPNLILPIFSDSLKCDLDWQAWERISQYPGSFIYADAILMRHRIHEGSETTSLIEDETRSREDLEMLEQFWPPTLACLVNKIYSYSQRSNHLR